MVFQRLNFFLAEIGFFIWTKKKGGGVVGFVTVDCVPCTEYALLLVIYLNWCIIAHKFIKYKMFTWILA